MECHQDSEDHSAYAASDDTGLQKRQPEPTPKPIQLDPKALLNPKSANQQQQSNGHDARSSRKRTATPNDNVPRDVPQFGFDFAKPFESRSDEDDDQESKEDTNGLSRLIEQAHGITDRDLPQVKRQKTTQNADTASWSGGKGSDVSKHFQQIRKEEAEKAQLEDEQALSQQETLAASSSEDSRKEAPQSSKPKETIDLTEDGEDEVTITRSVVKVYDPEEEEVCYGMVENALVSAHLTPSPPPKATYLSKEFWPMIKISFGRTRGKKNFIIVVYDGQRRDFGNLHPKTAYGVAPLLDSNLISRLQGRLLARKKEPYESIGASISTDLPLQLNVYGKRKHAEAVTRSLAQKKILMRRPLQFDKTTEYFNPFEENHGAKLKATGQTRPFGNPGGLSRTIEEMESNVMRIFDSSQEIRELPEMEASPSIRTPLLPHQKQALHFMTVRELDENEPEEEGAERERPIYHGNSLWRVRTARNGKTQYFNVIGDIESLEKPPVCQGGILADMMGLGKTLTVLSLCASTRRQARQWAAYAPAVFVGEPSNSKMLKNIKSTLLVAPLSVLANWEEQIKTHTRPNTMSYYVYHSKNRESDPQKLGEYDLIITTYTIVAAELHRTRTRKNDAGSPFENINFFRIVLDEAHAIREQSTLQSKSICMLSSPRRWAVTGTPIQNKLEDFGSLLRFIRLSPFDTHFRQTIIGPFKMAEPNVIPRLRLLVDSVTLRRTKERIDLPERFDFTRELTLSEREEKLYRWFATDARRKVKAIAAQEKLGGKRWHTFLRTILACRTICDAMDLLNEDDMKLAEGYSDDLPMNIDDDEASPEMSDRTAYEMLSLFEESDMVNCANCGKDRLLDRENENGVIGYMLGCYQIVCPGCITEFKERVEKIIEGNTFTCPFCDVDSLLPRYFELTEAAFEKAKLRAEELKKKPRQKVISRYNGPSTKTSALIWALEEARLRDSDNPKLPKNKSVVFSCWTSYLDLIEIALEEAELPFKYVRLDGKMSREKRKASLEAFKDDPEVTVLLASIGAGGLGLNLTSANAVYIMEPQWNPAAEAQAVDRVHRLGQKRDVTTVRFIIDGTVENGMREMQQKKLDLADLSMTKKKMDKKETAKERLEKLASLFK